MFAVGPSGLNLAAGKAWSSGGEGNDSTSRTHERHGGFELPAGEAEARRGFALYARRLAGSDSCRRRRPSSCPSRRAWILSSISGREQGQARSSISCSRTTRRNSRGFIRRASCRSQTGKLPGRLAAGQVRICRQVLHSSRRGRQGGLLDRVFFEVKAGETKTIRCVATRVPVCGARSRGPRARHWRG